MLLLSDDPAYASKGISHHVVTPTKGAEAGAISYFQTSSAQNTPTRKAHRNDQWYGFRE